MELTERKFSSPEFCLPFAQTVDLPVCPCKLQTTTKFKYERKKKTNKTKKKRNEFWSYSKKTSSCKWPINLLYKLLQINNTNTATIRNIETYTPQYYSIGFWLGCGPLDSLPRMISKLVYQGTEVRNKKCELQLFYVQQYRKQSRLSIIIRVNIVLSKTVVDSD